MLVKFWLEISRDLLGLMGAGLTAYAFFRLEGRKIEARLPKEVKIEDPDLARFLQDVSKTLEGEVLGPNEIDATLTFWKFVLIALSFLVSIGLTTAGHYELFGQPTG